MQFQADLLGIPVEVAAEHETTALGAAALAAGHGARVAVGAVFEPQLSADRVVEQRSIWRAALERAKTGSAP
jgi:glycerol kinase